MTDYDIPNDSNAPLENNPKAAAPFYTKRPKLKRLPGNTPALEDYISEWISRRRRAVGQIIELDSRAAQGRLWQMAAEQHERWHVLDVGNGRTAWMERAITSGAASLDFRVKNLSRRLQDPEDPAISDTEAALFPFCTPDPEVPDAIALTPFQKRQVRTALTFSDEWQRYLIQILAVYFRGRSKPANTLIAKLAHCRPTGAYFSSWLQDEWTQAGGRDVCRQPLFCPSCHARQAVRLVQRVEAGPWSETRRKGKHLVMLRAAIPTTSLDLYSDFMSQERECLKYENWLTAAQQIYTAESKEGAMICRLEFDQGVDQTLTRDEVAAAGNVLSGLVLDAKECGMTGGLRIHQVGPRKTEEGRRFAHELSVVGEIADRDMPRLAKFMGLDTDQPAHIAGQPVECIAIPGGYADAARVLIAGTSVGFDLRRIGARRNGVVRPKGMRGAMAWPPLYLMSAANWWSRYIVLSGRRHQTYRAWGSWRKRLSPDKDFESPVKRHRWRAAGGPLTEGWARDPVRRLRYFIGEKNISRATLAKAAGVSKAAVTRLLRDNHGSPELIAKLQKAYRDLSQQPDGTKESDAPAV